MKNQSNIIEKLRGQGERITPLRLALIEILAHDKTPRSPQELLLALSERGFKANKTTIYRQMEFLTRRAIVQEFNFADRVKRYELIADSGHHHHLVCLRCEKIADVSFPTDLEKQEKLIKRRHHFKVLQHSLEFFGLCRHCQTNK